MTDIVERLRADAGYLDRLETQLIGMDVDLRLEVEDKSPQIVADHLRAAATEIERLRSQPKGEAVLGGEATTLAMPGRASAYATEVDKVNRSTDADIGLAHPHKKLAGVCVYNTEADEAASSMPPSPRRKRTMSDFQRYRRSQIAELRAYEPGEDMSGVSVSASDKEAGSPRAGDMIARNPKNHADQWLVAAQYFTDNFELIDTALARAEALPPAPKDDATWNAAIEAAAKVAEAGHADDDSLDMQCKREVAKAIRALRRLAPEPTETTDDHSGNIEAALLVGAKREREKIVEWLRAESVRLRSKGKTASGVGQHALAGELYRAATRHETAAIAIEHGEHLVKTEGAS